MLSQDCPFPFEAYVCRPDGTRFAEHQIHQVDGGNTEHGGAECYLQCIEGEELRVVVNLPKTTYGSTYSHRDLRCSVDRIYVNCDIYDEEGKAEVGLVQTTSEGLKFNGHLHFAALKTTDSTDKITIAGEQLDAVGEIEVLLYPAARKPAVKRSGFPASAQRRPFAPATTSVRSPATNPFSTPVSRSIGLSAGTVHEKKKDMRSTVVVAKSSRPPYARETDSLPSPFVLKPSASQIRPATVSGSSSTPPSTGLIESARDSVKREKAKFYAMPVPTYRLLFKYRTGAFLLEKGIIRIPSPEPKPEPVVSNITEYHESPSSDAALMARELKKLRQEVQQLRSEVYSVPQERAINLTADSDEEA